MENIKLLFAIGNPESEYKNTRHNIGIYFLKTIINKLELSLIEKKDLKCYISVALINGRKILMVISNSYMIGDLIL